MQDFSRWRARVKEIQQRVDSELNEAVTDVEQEIKAADKKIKS